MPVFLERFLLPLFAAAVLAIALTNPMRFDRTQRVTGSFALIFAAYFVAHTTFKLSGQTRTSPSPGTAVSENVHATDTAVAVATRVAPTVAGPKLLVTYKRYARLSDGLILKNDGTEAALKIQVQEVSEGSWRLTFPNVPILQKDEELKVSPRDLRNIDPKVQTSKKRTVSLASMFRNLSLERRATAPFIVPVRVAYESHSSDDKFESRALFEYDPSTDRIELKVLKCGRVVTIPPDPRK